MSTATKRNHEKLTLASASPRRIGIIEELGIPFDVIPSGIDENLFPETDPELRVLRCAEAKIKAVSRGTGSSLILAADTVVVVDNEVLGKPSSRGEAEKTLEKLSSREHVVITGLALQDSLSTRRLSRSRKTEVRFSTMTSEEIKWYVGTGEPMDKAGSYGIQGYASLWIESIKGSYSNVVGLPVELLYTLIKELGLKEWLLSRIIESTVRSSDRTRGGCSS